MTMSDLFLTMPNMRIGRKDHTECTFCMTTGHTWKTCFNLFGFPNKTTDASKFKRGEPIFSDEDYQEYLRLKASRQAQPPLTSSISTACISQSMDIQGPWVIDKGAFDHISGDASLFTSMSSQKFPHLINFANGSNVTSKGIGQISLCPSLTLKSVLFVPNCPFGLISLS